MKKILAALLVLALGMPALAVVDITATDAGNQQLLISFTTSGSPAPVVRGMALELTVTGGDVTTLPGDVLASDFNTYVDYAFSNPTGYDVGEGHPLAKTGQAGELTVLPSSHFSVSVGHLDQTGSHGGLANGTVIKLQLHNIAAGGSATVAIAVDAIRGGAVVGNDLGTVNVQASQVIAGPPIVYNLTTSSTAGGDVTTPGEPGPYPYNAGTVVDIVATPDANYHFVNWTGDTANIANVNLASTTITMNANAAIVANFAIDQRTLTTSSTAGGDVTTPGEPGPYSYDYGFVAPIVATPAGGYNFVNWTGDTANIANVNLASTTITMNANAAIVANFVIAENVSTPTTPTVLGTRFFGGNTPAIQVLPVTTGGSTCSIGGHLVQYRFDWGDGVISPWGATGVVFQTKGYATPAYVWTIKAQARCATNNAIVSAWSAPATGTVANECQKFNLTRRINAGTDNSLNASDLNVLITYVNANRSNPAAFATLIAHPNYDYRYNFDTSTSIAAGDLNAIITYVNLSRTNPAGFARACTAIPPGE
jgi:hypothetical protein